VVAVNRTLNMTLLLWWWHLKPWSSVYRNVGPLVNPFESQLAVSPIVISDFLFLLALLTHNSVESLYLHSINMPNQPVCSQKCYSIQTHSLVHLMYLFPLQSFFPFILCSQFHILLQQFQYCVSVWFSFIHHGKGHDT